MNHDNKAIVVTRRTRFEELVSQYNTEEQARFVIESRDSDFDDYKLEHSNYRLALKTVEAELKRSARVQLLEREFLPNFIFGPEDIIVVIGQDGLVANTIKYLSGQPLIAINPEPQRYDGVLLPFQVDDIGSIFKDVVRENYSSKVITMAKATLNDGQELVAVNDLFIGPRYQISARYELSINGKSETQSSSGVIVSTGLGSTGWLKSVVSGAARIVGYSNNNLEQALAWDADFLNYAVREPFPSQLTGTELVFGRIKAGSPMMLSSQMANHGVIFSDGMIDDFIDFNSGAVAELSISEQKGQLVC